MKESTSLIFTGDIGFDKYMDKKWTDKGLLSNKILDFLNSGDHVIANVEGALSDGDKQLLSNSVASLMHSMNPEVASFLQDIGADIWNIANNHIMDVGPKGMEDTLREADRHGAYTIGAGMNIGQAATPLFLDEAGGIGMFGVGYQRGCKKATEDIPGSFSWSDMDRIRDTIAHIKQKCRWCIVVAHGGEEFTSLPSPYTRDRYIEYLNMGADIVVSHHPHVPMNYETFDGKAIFYSLGNFIFDTDYQRVQFNTQKGVLLKINLDAKGFNFEPMGIKIDRENEKVVEGELPLIFEDVKEDEYNLLEPLAAKAFVDNTKRQQIFLNPDKYTNATDEEWEENFMNPKRSGRVEGEGLDFHIICPIAEKEKDKAWKRSKLTNVVEYIRQQIIEE
ncbi:MAG: CapA family protein [Lachnospiraceae bacterium]|nr:CapA family protein [Candidatus Colinaster equi]